MKPLKYPIVLILLLSLTHLAKAQTASAGPLPKYPWIITLKWGGCETDNWAHAITVEKLVQGDYTKIEALDPWGTGHALPVIGMEVEVSCLDRKTREMIRRNYELTDGDLAPVLQQIEQCGSSGDEVAISQFVVAPY
ncbi:MAG: hypothetical protein AAFO94_20380, partial [Bacteroidota bacterium]